MLSLDLFSMGKWYLALVFFARLLQTFQKLALFFNKAIDHGAGGDIKSTSGLFGYLQEPSALSLLSGCRTMGKSHC